jgi:hypothetical protein
MLFGAGQNTHHPHAASSLADDMLSGLKLYPNPRTELMNWGWQGPASSFLRNRNM